MATKIKNRKQIEKLIYETFDLLDPSGINTKRYKEFFGSMSDTEFTKFMKEFLNNPDENFTYDIIEFDNDIKMENAEAAASYLDIPLMETVYMPHLTMDKDNVVATKEKCLVGYINVKRTQQLLHKKNSLSTSSDKISPLTGQVIGDDKNSRVIDMEGSMLVALNCNMILKEFYGPRADDHTMKRQMNKQIADKGYVSIDELDSISTNKVTLNTINTYLLGMGLKSDLVSGSYVLPKTTLEVLS